MGASPVGRVSRHQGNVWRMHFFARNLGFVNHGPTARDHLRGMYWVSSSPDVRSRQVVDEAVDLLPIGIRRDHSMRVAGKLSCGESAMLRQGVKFDGTCVDGAERRSGSESRRGDSSGDPANVSSVDGPEVERGGAAERRCE